MKQAFDAPCLPGRSAGHTAHFIGRWRVVTVALAFVLMLFPARLCAGTEASGTVVWMEADQPVSFIVEGPDKGRGVVDELYKILWSELPGYTHLPRRMNFSRVLKGMKSGENVCAVGLYSPEREKEAVFSIPALALLPFSIVAKKGRLEHIFGNVESISLQGLLARGDLVGGIMPGRSYGDLDPLVAAESDRPVLRVLSPGADRVEMLMKERLDYVIEIAPFMTYMAGKSGNRERLTSFAIQESGVAGFPVHVFCTNTDWGREFIKRINEIIRKHRNDPAYLEINERWLDDNARPRFREFFKKTILEE